jgi:tRNA pseudouridine55 synthase
MLDQPELILTINKPLNWTSFDAVNRLKTFIRHNFPEHKKIKIGHAGTLDPLATGVLVVCLGKATKKIDLLQNTLKEYTGTIELGATTPSYDLETEVDQRFETSHITNEMINEIAKTFIGVQQQTPPQFSAKKINGKRAYESAREGEVIVMRSNEIEIMEMEIVKVEMPKVYFRIVCSKGTYIRSIAYDLGKKLNSGGHLTSLCRTRSGEFTLEKALDLDQSSEKINVYLSKTP